MTSIIGMAGLALDLGAAYAQMAELQKTADSAAMAGGLSLIKSGSSTQAVATIKAVVAANGWPVSAVRSATYLAQSPKNAGNAAMQVMLAAPSALTLARVVSSLTSVTTTVSSVAEIGASGSASSDAPCLLATQILMINGTVNAAGCAVAANSTSSSAITVNGGGSLTASSINTPGGVVRNGSITGSVNTGAPPATDPYSALQSAVNGQTGNPFTNCQNYNNQKSLTPGCWQNVNIGSAVTLAPGTYYFQGSLNVNSGGSITGLGAPPPAAGSAPASDFQGVTIVTQGTFSPNGNITINAPTDSSNPFSGVAIYAMGGMNMNSGVTYNINGTIYAPTGTIIPNAGTWNQNACTYLDAENLTFNGGGKLTLPQSGCSLWNFPGHSATTTYTVALVQ